MKDIAEGDFEGHFIYELLNGIFERSIYYYFNCVLSITKTFDYFFEAIFDEFNLEGAFMLALLFCYLTLFQILLTFFICMFFLKN